MHEERGVATRHKLMCIGVRLFLKDGFIDTTLDQIVEPLGIGRRTFFRYFKTKEDLVLAWIEEKNRNLVEDLIARREEEQPYAAACQSMRSLLAKHEADPGLTLAMIRVIKETPSLSGRQLELRMAWELALARALMQRAGRNPIDSLKARVIAGKVMTAWSAALDEWYGARGQADLRSIVESALSMTGDRAP